MKRGSMFIRGLGIGAGLMYALDPQSGRRRRAVAQGKTVHAARRARQTLAAASRDAAHRAKGLVAETRSALRQGPVDDDVLVERVRARLGRVTTHPSAIEVSVAGGRVLLKG